MDVCTNLVDEVTAESIELGWAKDRSTSIGSSAVMFMPRLIQNIVDTRRKSEDKWWKRPKGLESKQTELNHSTIGITINEVAGSLGFARYSVSFLHAGQCQAVDKLVNRHWQAKINIAWLRLKIVELVASTLCCWSSPNGQSDRCSRQGQFCSGWRQLAGSEK